MTGATSRGQLVLLAAVVVVVALVPVALTYQQLGYHPDVERAADADARGLEEFSRTVPPAVETAVTAGDGRAWARHEGAVHALKSRLAPTLERLTRPDVERGTTYETAYNQTAATAIAAGECPRGPNRQFGTCRAVGGVVVQKRANETAIVAVALDVRVSGPDERTQATIRTRLP